MFPNSRLTPTSTVETCRHFTRKWSWACPHALQQAQPIAVFCQQQLAIMLRQPARQIDKERPLASYGLDSLMAIELKTAVLKTASHRTALADLLEAPPSSS